jgi:hypothetical protein
MTPCLNEETLQAYFDGELAPGTTAQVIKHLAECDGCAASAFEVERAIELMASAFDDELPDAVPSERLRERIGAALAGDSASAGRVRPAGGFWPRILEAPVLNLLTLSPRRLAYASIGILSLVCAVWFGVRSEFYQKEPEKAHSNQITVPTPAPSGNHLEPKLAEASPDRGIEKRKQGADNGTAPSGSRRSSSPKRYASSKQEPSIIPLPNESTHLAQGGAEWVGGIRGDSRWTDGTVFDAGMIQHFEKAQILLRSFRNSDTSPRGFAANLAYERRQSKSLLYRNILLRRNAENSGNLPAEEVLGSLEPVLLDIANLPDRASPDDVRPIKERINKMEIIGVLQVYSAPSMLAGYQQY